MTAYLTYYWIGSHDYPNADGDGLLGNGGGVNVGIERVIPADELADGLPAPRCVLGGCEVEQHRLTLTDEATYRVHVESGKTANMTARLTPDGYEDSD